MSFMPITRFYARALQRNFAAAIVTPFAPRNGTLRAGAAAAGTCRPTSRLSPNEVRAQPGQPVGLSKGGFRAPLYIELMSADADEVRRSVDEIASWQDLYEIE